MGAQKYAKEWLERVQQELQDEVYPKKGLPLFEHLADAFIGSLPMEEKAHNAVLQELRALNPVELLGLQGGQDFYINIFVPESWYAENNAEMTWEEFRASKYAPEGLN